jgi:hypothetical protein
MLDNLPPYLADMFDAIMNPPHCIREMEENVLKRMRGEITDEDLEALLASRGMENGNV